MLIRPAGAEAAYVVDNPVWPSRIGDKTEACCAPGGSTVDGEKPRWATVPEASYWLLGDNRGGSTDSRDFGWVTADRIKGTPWLRMMPSDRVGTVDNEVRLVPRNAL